MAPQAVGAGIGAGTRYSVTALRADYEVVTDDGSLWVFRPDGTDSGGRR